MAPWTALLVILPMTLTLATDVSPGCKIRVTSKGLDLVHEEALKFVEQELENISIPDLLGNEGQFHYNISQVKITHLQIRSSNLDFEPSDILAFQVANASISLEFQRKLYYWFFYDMGAINASAEGVDIDTKLKLTRDAIGRLKILNITCSTAIQKMNAYFSGTLGSVYHFLATFIANGMQYLVNQQICPALKHAGLVLLNSLLDTVPVRTPVDDYVGIDYSLLKDPIVTSEHLDMNFKGMFYDRANENNSLPNTAVPPLIKDSERMVYLALSEYFFDSAMDAYYKAGVFSMDITGEKMPVDLEMLLRTTYFGSIVLLNPSAVDAPIKMELQVSSTPRCVIKPSGNTVSVTATMRVILLPPGAIPIQLSSMTMEAKLSAIVSLKGKRISVHLTLRRFKIYSNHSTLESLALIPLQTPLKTLLQISIVPLLNAKTEQGVQIPLPEGMDVINEVVTNHSGFITIGADLHFYKGLREVIDKYRSDPGPSINETAQN